MGSLVVVGSGIAGHQAALAAKRANPKANVTIVTQEREPLYSACVLADYVAGEVPRERVFLSDWGSYERIGIQVLHGRRAKSLDPQRGILGLDDGTSLGFHNVVLATGSLPFRPPLPGVDLKGVHVLKTIEDADAIMASRGSRAVVVGSGPVGVEISLALRKRGWEVTMVELLDRVLPRVFDRPISMSIQNHLEGMGIKILLEEGIEAVEGDKKVEGVRTSQRSIGAQMVVMVAGMRPEVSLARQCGIRLGEQGGIWVDSSMRTSVQNVWACGDCVESRELTTHRSGLFMLWNNAKLQGEVAGSNAGGLNRTYRGSLNLTTLNLHKTAAASVGLLEAELKEDEVATIHKRTLRGELFLVIKDGRIAGVQALGEVERVGGLISLIIKGVHVKDITEGRATAAGPSLSWPLRDVASGLRSISRCPSITLIEHN